MKEDLFDDPYFNEEFNDNWDSGNEEDDDFSIDPDDINNRIDWMEDIEDPDLLENLNFDELEDMDDMEDGFNYDE